MTDPVSPTTDIEICAVYKNPFITVKFDWTVEDYDVEVEGCYQSPVIPIRDAVLNFTLKREYNKQNEYFDSVLIESSATVHVMGSIMVNGVQYTFNIPLDPFEVKPVVHFINPIYRPVVKLVFDLKVYGLSKKKLVFSKGKSERIVDENKCQMDFLDKFQSLYQNPQFSDVVIKAGDYSIPAHKIILSAQSPVFAGMFQNPTLENTKNIVDVRDIAFDTLEILIKFIYGCFPNLEVIEDMDKLCELYYAGDKYQILDLRDLCGQELVKRMTTENVFRLLNHFDRHSDTESLNQVVSFCCMYFKDIFETDGWKNVIWRNPKFASIVFGQMAHIYGEK